jgi:hypothetical protein
LLHLWHNGKALIGDRDNLLPFSKPGDVVRGWPGHLLLLAFRFPAGRDSFQRAVLNILDLRDLAR